MRISDGSSDVCSSDLTFVVMSNVLGGIRRYDSGGFARRCHGDAAAHVLGGVKLKAPHPLTAEAERLLRVGWQTDLSAEVVNEIDAEQIGRATWRESVWTYVYISVVAVILKKKE